MWHRTYLVVPAILIMGSICSAQEPTSRELLDRIDRLEKQAADREQRIGSLENRLADYENGEIDPSKLETLIQALEATDPQVSAPRSLRLRVGGQLRFRGEHRTTKNYGAGVEEGVDFVI